MRPRIAQRVGRRGAFLLFLAVLDFVYAWALHLATTPQQAHVQPDYLLPWQVWAVWYVVAGLANLAGAFAKKDMWAFAQAALLKAAWGSLSLILWFRGQQPNGWLSAVIWLCLAATVLVIASWPEPRAVVIVPVPDIKAPHAPE
jgi:hypothetical protein